MAYKEIHKENKKTKNKKNKKKQKQKNFKQENGSTSSYRLRQEEAEGISL